MPNPFWLIELSTLHGYVLQDVARGSLIFRCF